MTAEEFALLTNQLNTMLGVPNFDAAAWLSRWLHTALPALGGVRPIDHAATAEGFAQVASLLAQIGSGAYA